MYKYSLIFIFILVAFFHIWQIADLPKGFFVDESAIGYNTYLISQTGHDENNEFMPLYFKTFHTSKYTVDPVYIYTASALFYLFGPSEFVLRFTSALFFLLFLLGLYLLAKRLFNSKIAIIYSLLAGGFLPWFFSISRISFAIIAELPAIVFSIYFFYLAQEKKSKLYASLAGILAGVFFYTYGIARMSSFFLIFAFFLVYIRKNMKILIYSGTCFAITLVPYFLYSLKNHDSVNNRFRDPEVTYIYDSSLSLITKAWMFLKNYFNYISLKYLLVSGDTTLRHNIGKGEIYFSVFILLLIGIIYILKNKPKFGIFLLVGLVLAPVPAALTTGDSSLRSILIGFYILLISTYGIYSLKKKPVAILLIILLALESSIYLENYFIKYPAKSITEFQSYDFKDAIVKAISQNPKNIIVSNVSNNGYMHFLFYSKMIKKEDIPYTYKSPIASKDTCVIYFPFSSGKVDNPNNLEVKYQSTNNFTKLKCY